MWNGKANKKQSSWTDGSVSLEKANDKEKTEFTAKAVKQLKILSIDQKKECKKNVGPLRIEEDDDKKDDTNRS